MKKVKYILAALFAVVAVNVAVLPAEAWPAPDVTVSGGACTDGVRAPVVVTVVNKESGNPGSPAHIEDYVINPMVVGLTATPFAPAVLPNTGSASATSNITVPSNFSGMLGVTLTMVWAPNGDSKTAAATINLEECEVPTTTTAPTTSFRPPTTTAPCDKFSAPEACVKISATSVVHPMPIVAVHEPATPVGVAPKFTG